MAARLFAVLILLVAGTSGAEAEKRVALVIGNASYEHVPALANPSNDAADIGSVLKSLGFEVVEGIDLKQNEMRETVRRFGEALQGADVALFFYAGHGMQVAGTNYLVPIDAKLAREGDLDFDAIRLDLVLAQMERETKTSIVLLDACRDNPMAQTLARSMGTRSANIGRGLARIESGVGTFIAFATQPGNVALDGQGRNSPFTAALVKHLPAEAVDLGAIMIAVRNDVLASTQGKQVPWEHSSLTGQFFFKPAAMPAPAPAPSVPSVAQGGADSAIELAFWNSVKDSSDPQILKTYLDRYPSGSFATLARVMMERLEKGAAADAPKVAALAAPSAAGAAAPKPEARMLTLRATLKLREGDSSGRPYLGVQIGKVTEDLAKTVGLSEAKGAAVSQLVRGAPAEFAGIQPGDVIVKFEGASVEDPRDLTRRIMEMPSGKDVSLEIWRIGNGPSDFLRWLRDRADAGDEVAVKSLAEIYAQNFSGADPSGAIRAYRRAVDIGDGPAMYRLGIAYVAGSGVGKDEVEAARWFRKGADAGHATSMTELARSYVYGVGISKDEAEGVRWYRKAAELNEPWAIYNLGYLYEFGSAGLVRDEAEAVRLYRKSADLGNTDASVNLSVMLLNGRGAAKDEQEAVRLLRKASELNHPRSFYVLAGAYEQGLGVGKDLNQAMENYRKAAERGYSDAWINLGYMNEKGIGVAKNEAEAVNLYRKAADLNNSLGMTNLAMMLENGRGTKKDVDQAVGLYRKAADMNQPVAMVALGWLYENGKGVKRDNAEAARLYRKAAELGEPQGMHNLAGLLAAGRGVRTDTEEAAQWAIKAIQRKNTSTIEQMRTNSAAWGLPFRKALQRQLKEQGVYSGPVDGKFGGTTQAAINALANSN
ncbi:MAG TPA: caspase family protein [Methyloceanibacter sp.]|nr:caspase family protein [Methyloceanibacter sp.]